MIINPDIIRRETVKLLTSVEKEMKEYEEGAVRANKSPFEVSDNGRNDYALLVSAKLSALNTLALLNQGEK